MNRSPGSLGALPNQLQPKVIAGLHLMGIEPDAVVLNEQMDGVVLTLSNGKRETGRLRVARGVGHRFARDLIGEQLDCVRAADILQLQNDPWGTGGLQLSSEQPKSRVKSSCSPIRSRAKR